MAFRICVLALAVMAVVGCKDSDPAPAETKPNAVQPQLTAEQQAYMQQHANDPNYDPSEAAARSKKGK